MSSKIEKLFNRAREMALRGEMEMLHGAILVKGNRVISDGFNSYRTKMSTFVGSSETFLVACRDVINVRLGFYLPISPFRVRGKGKKLDRASYDLYIVRIAYTLEGKEYYAMSRPCKSCLALLKSYGVRRVYYTVLSRPGELRYQMEKIKDMETDHISGGMRSTFSNSKNVFAKY